MSCEAAESVEDAIRDNRMFAERAFYCIANGAGSIPKMQRFLFIRKYSKILIPGSKGLSPHELAHKWEKDKNPIK